MTIDRNTRRATGIALSLCAALACGEVSDPQEGGGIAGYPMVGDTPAIELEDGSVYLLERLDEWEAVRQQFPLPDEGPPPELEAPDDDAEPRAAALDLPPATLPERVDLRPEARPGVVFHRFDTIEDQAGRGTCVAFATVAAIEAAYQRERGLVVDLSEQYANHIQKMTALPDDVRDPSERETQLGAWGGSGVGYQLGWLFRLRFGIPDESAHADLAYIGSGNYGSTNQDGDVPRIDWRQRDNQREIDLWNLSSTPTAYAIPEARTLTNLPRAGLAGATYGVRRVRAVDRSVEAIKAELAAGREVAFGVSLTRPAPGSGASAFRDGMWIPLSDDDGGEGWGGHAMLIVGYDDARGAFLVKNSWGRDSAGRGRPAAADADADGYIEMSYDWMPYIYETYSVLETRDPDTWLNRQPWLGHWQAELDGPLGRADLAVYHLPGAFPDAALGGQRDHRLGTLYADGATHRVNGWIAGSDQLRAHFGTDARYDRMTGTHRIDAHRVGFYNLAGWVVRAAAPAERSPFFATLNPLPTMAAARSEATGTELADYLGSWELRGGDLRLTRALASVVTGTYRAPGEDEVDAILRVSADDPCRFSLELDFAEGLRIHDGGLFCDTDSPARHALMAGTWQDGGIERGFYASRQGDARIEILSPSDGGSDSRGARVEFSAEASGATEIVWSSDIDGEIGRGATLYLFDLSYGTHEITATATHASGDTSRDTVTLTITNDAPVVTVVAPDPGDGPFCTGEPITFRAVATDFNEWPTRVLPDDAVSWFRGAAEIGVGKEIVHTFQAPATESITVRGTDSGGLSDEASIEITIEDCPDNPPTVAITSPAADSGMSDSDYVYDGYDDALGMWYTDVPVVGSASDPEDGPLSGASLQWTTDRTDLQPASVGSGASPVLRLYSDVCTGTWHEITLRATDSDGNMRSVVRRLFIWTLC